MGAMQDGDAVDVTLLGAAEALELLREGVMSAEDLARGCLARIAADEPRVQAWAFVDEERALAQARRVDEARREGQAHGGAARPARRREGHHRHRRHAHRARHACCTPGAGRSTTRPSCACCARPAP